MYVYVCIYVFMCVPKMFAISDDFSEACFYFAYYFPFIFELQVIYQVRENRDKGKAGLHFWAFLVLCENGVEESEFFYFCPEQGVMKSIMIL